MKKTCYMLIFLMSIFMTVCSGSSSDDKDVIPNLTSEQKEEDFEYLCEIFSKNYPYFEVNKRLNGVDWLANRNSYKSRICGTTSNISFAVELYKAVEELNCEHAGVLMSNFSTFAEIYLGNYGSLMNNEPWEAVFSEAKPFYDDYWLPLFQNRLNNISESFKTKNNDIINKSLLDGNAVSFKIIESGKTAYMSISSMAIPTDTEYSKIINFYKNIKSYQNLIIDIRENSGGDDYYWVKMIVPPLLKNSMSCSFTILHRNGSYAEKFLESRGVVLSDISALPIKSDYPPEYKTMFSRFYNDSGIIEPADSVGFGGKIYILTSSKVFSSAETFAMFCKQTGFATLVGTKTGGDGGGIDPIEIILPNSKLVVRFPIGMTLNSDGSSNFEKKTTPDVLIEANEDALQRALSIINGE